MENSRAPWNMMTSDDSPYLWDGANREWNADLCTIWNGIEVEVHATNDEGKTYYQARARMVDVEAFNRAFPTRIGSDVEEVLFEVRNWREFRWDEDDVFVNAKQVLEEETYYE